MPLLSVADSEHLLVQLNANLSQTDFGGLTHRCRTRAPPVAKAWPHTQVHVLHVLTDSSPDCAEQQSRDDFAAALTCAAA